MIVSRLYIYNRADNRISLLVILKRMINKAPKYALINHYYCCSLNIKSHYPLSSNFSNTPLFTCHRGLDFQLSVYKYDAL
jgi:hypothetical protein